MLIFAVLWGVSSGIGAQAFYSLWASEMFATPYRASAQGVMFCVVRSFTGLLSYFFPTLLAVTGLTGVGLLLIGLLDRRTGHRRGLGARDSRKNAAADRDRALRPSHGIHLRPTKGSSMTNSLLDNLKIELPSWAFGNSGTRFKVFGTPGTPRTIEEKIADAATVHRFTGLAPTVALHIPWDKVDDFAALGKYAEDHGVAAGHHQLQHLSGRRLQVRQPDPHGQGGAAEGDRPPPRVHRHHGCNRIARPEDLARRRHQLSGPGRHPWSPGPPGGIAGHDLPTHR